MKVCVCTCAHTHIFFICLEEQTLRVILCKDTKVIVPKNYCCIWSTAQLITKADTW